MTILFLWSLLFIIIIVLVSSFQCDGDEELKVPGFIDIILHMVRTAPAVIQIIQW